MSAESGSEQGVPYKNHTAGVFGESADPNFNHMRYLVSHTVSLYAVVVRWLIALN